MPSAIVHVETADPRRPTAAARASASALGRIPRRRGLTGLVVGWSPLPGLAVTPWTLRGVSEAVPDGVELHWEAIANAGASDRALRASMRDRVRDVRVDKTALERGAVGERRVSLSIAGQRRPAAIPRAWVGSNLCVVAPLCHAHAIPARDALGPVRLTLSAIARRCGLEGSASALARAGATIAAEAFCASWLVLDATWWSALSGNGDGIGDPTAIEHCLGTSALTDADEAAAVDQWIAALLGHRGVRPTSPPKISGRRTPWPNAPMPVGSGRAAIASRGTGPANRAFDALWRSGRSVMSGGMGLGGVTAGRRNGRAVAPRPPGRFADHWTRWSADRP